MDSISKEVISSQDRQYYSPVTACPTVWPIADPIATPPAVAAICPNNPGPCAGAGAEGAAWTGAGGAAGRVLAGRFELLEILLLTIVGKPLNNILISTKK